MHWSPLTGQNIFIIIETVSDIFNVIRWVPLFSSINIRFTDWSAKEVRQIVFADQSVNRVVIADADIKAIVWEWNPAQSNVAAGDGKWFVNMSDAKPVYNNK